MKSVEEVLSTLTTQKSHTPPTFVPHIYYRYELHFTVSDQLWGQVGVSANVTVAVRLLDPDALAHAAHITLTPTTPERLAKGWTPHGGGGGLGRIVDGVSRVVGGALHEVEVISVQSHPRVPAGDTTTTPQQDYKSPAVSVWVSVRDGRGRLMDPVKLQGLLALHASQVCWVLKGDGWGSRGYRKGG